jgi:hypothetical protein
MEVANDRSRDRFSSTPVCSTALLCPLVFGFPTEMWDGRTGTERLDVLSLASWSGGTSGIIQAAVRPGRPARRGNRGQNRSGCPHRRKARQFDAKDGVTDPEPGSNASDDGMRSVLGDRKDDPVLTELTNFIHDLNADEQIDLVALTWLGRGDGEIENWDELHAEAARAHNKRTAAYLLGKPMLADHLEETLSKFGHSTEEVEADLF